MFKCCFLGGFVRGVIVDGQDGDKLRDGLSFADFPLPKGLDNVLEGLYNFCGDDILANRFDSGTIRELEEMVFAFVEATLEVVPCVSLCLSLLGTNWMRRDDPLATVDS